MTRASKSLIVLVVAALGLWGCAKGPSGHSTAHAERIRALEAKCVKLEDDYRSTAAARDQLRKHTAALEGENARLEKVREQLSKEVEELKLVVLERDQLKLMLAARTSERDLLSKRCDSMKKGLQALIGQDDAMANPATPAAPVSAASTTAPAPVSPKS